MRELRLVVGRELTEAVRRRTFWAVIGFVLLLSTAGMVGPELIDRRPDAFQVGVVGGDGGLEAPLQGGAELVDRELLTIDEVVARIEAVTLEDVAELARELFTQPEMLAVVGPSK